jgi:hypothetical protein
MGLQVITLISASIEFRALRSFSDASDLLHAAQPEPGKPHPAPSSGLGSAGQVTDAGLDTGRYQPWMPSGRAPKPVRVSLCEAAALAIRVSLQVRRRPPLSAPDTVSCQVVRSVAERVSYGTYEVGESLLPPRRGLDPV